MKIAIYYPWVYLKGGPERTILEMRRRSRHDWTVFTSHYDRAGTFPEFEQIGVVELPRVSVQRRYGTVLRAAAQIAATKLDLTGYDALVVCCDGLGSLLNFRNATKPIACLCFTPLRAVYDEEYRARHLGTHQSLKPLALALERAWVQLDRWAWRRYEHVFCISETVKERVLRGGLCPESALEVVYPGIDEKSIAPSAIHERFFFLPGRMMWTKNIELGIDAFLRSDSARAQGFRLVIAGMVDAKSQPYFAKLRDLAAGRTEIEFVRDPSDAQMNDLYRRCYATLFTAFNEDWGLTPLEAMAHGKPVIAVNRGGPTETIVHGATGLLVEPGVDAFAAAMNELIDRPEHVAAMGRQAAEHVVRFTWRSFTDRIDDYFEELGTSR
jgi:glycosyltransferase involved in cell wall biosynthesis